MLPNIEKAVSNLEKNGIVVQRVQKKSEVVPLLKTMLQQGEVITVGGSVTLDETDVLPLLKNGDYQYWDRFEEGLTNEQRQDVFRRAFTADTFISSTNAITEDGELYNVDGNANRVAAIAFGPKRVILVAGINKIVPDLKAAVRRVKTVTAPLNAKRLNCDTYCAATGYCKGVDGDMTDGCASSQRICCQYLISAKQRVNGRIQLILVDEPCGY